MWDLRRYWPSFLADNGALRERLVAAYSNPGRGYHDLRHLAEVLERVDLLLAAEGDRAVDRDVVHLAAWFHDAVYESDGDNEKRSAALAERELATAQVPPLTVAEVARLVRLTAGHRPSPQDRAGAVLCDADLGVLAADRERYREYIAGVRREYADLPDADFRAGRAAVLRDLTARRTLFTTAFGREHWEAPARANLARELAELA